MISGSYWHFAISLLIVLNPLGNLAIFIGLVGTSAAQHQRQSAIKCAIAVLVILLIIVWLGPLLLSFFGISIPAFAMAGGLVVAWIGLSMMFSSKYNRLHQASDLSEGEHHHQIAIVPMAIPIVAGPGAISTIIIHSNDFSSLGGHVLLSLICLVCTFVVGVLFYFAPFFRRVLGDDGIKVAQKVMGLVLTAIAMQLLGNGLLQMFPGLA